MLKRLIVFKYLTLLKYYQNILDFCQNRHIHFNKYLRRRQIFKNSKHRQKIDQKRQLVIKAQSTVKFETKMNIDIEDYDDIHKVILIGDSNTGKTSLVNAFSKQKIPLVPKPTIGVEYTSQTVTIDDYKKIKVQFWDTAGQEKYKAVTLNHYRGAVGAVIVFDITNRQSYENVAEWLAAVRERAESTVQILLVGNKKDLQYKRSVTESQAKLFAQKQRLAYAQTSINEADSVKVAFRKLVKNVSTTRKVGLKGIKVKLEEDEKKKLGQKDCPC